MKTALVLFLLLSPALAWGQAADYDSIGACCMPMQCFEGDQAGCEAAGGEWMGPGTRCDGGLACEEYRMTCCAADGSCSITYAVQCHGVWGQSFWCDPNPCWQPPSGVDDLAVARKEVTWGKVRMLYR